MCRGARGHRAVVTVKVSKAAAIVRVAGVERGGVVQRPGEDRAVGVRALGGGPRGGRAGAHHRALSQTGTGLWRVAAAFTSVRGRGDLHQGPQFGFRGRRGRVDHGGHVAGHRARRVAQVCRLVLLRNARVPPGHRGGATMWSVLRNPAASL